MKRLLAAALVAGLLCVSPVAVVGAEPARAEITAEQVREAIDKGVAYLKRQQRADGSWPEYRGQPGGVTALCTLALLSSGVPREDESIRKALRYLEKFTTPRNSYAVSLQTMAFCQADPVQYKAQIRTNVAALQKWQIKEGPSAGSWSYPGANGDNSNSQFALLALHEAELAGVPVERETWTRAKIYWENCQNLNGSWGYYKGLDGTGSMTCAGVAALIITADRFRQPNARVRGEQILCCQAEEAENDRIERGLQWLGRNFSVEGNPGARRLPGDPDLPWLLYYLYGLERVGRLTNQRFIGRDDPFGAKMLRRHDWYREGADYLVGRQDRMSGFWRGTGHVEADPILGTSLALLFVSKGRRPVLLAKLQHSVADDWNQHRSDVDNLTRYVEPRWKRELTWQVVNLKDASVDDLLQAPVLYFCGNLNPLPGTEAQRTALGHKLRAYLDRGGFLFAEGYGGGSGFDQGFRELMALVFPEPEYKLRLLEPGHPIWRAEEPVPAEHVRPLEGIEFGCRTSVVYARPDPPERPRPSLSCLWELYRSGRGEKFAASVQAQIDAAMIIGINVLAYATGREIKGKEDLFTPAATKQPGDQVVRGRLSVARLQHFGGCNAAPRALVNLLDAAAHQWKIRPQVRQEPLKLTDEGLFDYHLVFMHGRNSFRFTDAERAQLKAYLERGGMLFADSICTSAAFTESFRREMAAVFADRKLERIPPDDPLWTTAYGGFDLKTVVRRDPQPAGSGPLQSTRRRVPLDLEGIKLDDRWAVVFSQFDVSCALEKHDSLECRGYTREDAARIGLNVVLYSLQQ